MKDIQVLTPNRYNYLHATSTNLSVKTKGINKLVQEVTMQLKRTPNRDLFRPDLGVGLKRSLPLVHGKKTQQQVFTSLAASINKLESDIIDSQKETGLDDTEKLREIDLVEANFSEDSATWLIEIRVKAVSKEEAITIVSL